MMPTFIYQRLTRTEKHPMLASPILIPHTGASRNLSTFPDEIVDKLLALLHKALFNLPKQNQVDGQRAQSW
jgi:hypothetical protein